MISELDAHWVLQRFWEAKSAFIIIPWNTIPLRRDGKNSDFSAPWEFYF